MDKSARPYVLCDLPKAGLGNMLFPLLKAFVFGHLNNLPVVVTGYHRIKLGPFLRKEKSKRQYRSFFIFQKSIFGEFLDRMSLKRHRNYEIIQEPPLNSLNNIKGKIIYRFSAIPHWRDYFKGLKEHRHLVIEILWCLVRPEIKKFVESVPSPAIGVHVRRGDFRKLQPNDDFSKLGVTRTPETYFSEMIKSIREMCGEPLPVSIFTDGYANELVGLSTLRDVTIVAGNKDIEDMLLLSRSKIIVTSANSTFGYWAGFLSEAPIILHKDHIHEPIRGDKNLFEGPVDLSNDYLLKAVKDRDFSF